MELGFLLRGIAIGFSIAAPVGPIGALCIRRTLAYGRAIGIATGMGAACADGIFGSIAAFGLSAVSATLEGESVPFRVVGGALLLALGVRTFLALAARSSAPVTVRGIAAAWASTLGLTLTNPASIVLFAAAFAGLGLAEGATGGSAVALAGGVFLGSTAWWLLLVLGLGSLRERVGDAVLGWVNRASGGVIAAFGLAAFASLLL